MKQHIVNFIPDRLYLEMRWHYHQLKTQPNVLKEEQNRRNQAEFEQYSMKPFDSKKSIFVHIPKCAGVSISKALFGNLCGGHTTFDKYLNIFEPSCILSYFKFTVVRNPWDRLVSAYHFLKQGGLNEHDKAWAEKELGGFSSFDQFVHEWLNPKNIWKWYHFRPQHFYIEDRYGKIKLDFIGFYENLEEDFKYISHRINTKSSLGQHNKTDRSSYMNYYNKSSRQIVENLYRKDIDLLKYNFDNSSLDSQLKYRRNVL